MSEEINFADLVEAVAETNKAKAKAEREARDAAAAEAHRVKLEALRPILTVMRQVQERFPRLPIFCSDYGLPGFGISANARMEVRYNPDSGVISLRSVSSGYNHYKDEELISSRHAEDLIPLLVDMLAKLVSK